VSLQRRPGEVISEAEIALSYGVSRTPVREAILKLSDEGLSRFFRNRALRLAHSLAALPEAIIVRKALEKPPHDWRPCVHHPTQILSLHSSWSARARRTLPRTTTLSIKADEAFHATIAETAEYPGIWKLIPARKDSRRPLPPPALRRPEEWRQVIAEHEVILTAIEAHDPSSAQVAMERHLERLLADLSATQNIIRSSSTK